MANPHPIITGATGGATEGAVAPNRLEINDLIRNQEQFSLYIQAITAMYNTPQNDQLSHFGIGGIHGLPYTRWGDAGGTEPVEGSGWGGYCTHGSVLFPTWHRPYVALYEQAMQQHALDIANRYEDKERWLRAARNLRAPFWDWATNSIPPREVTSRATVTIITPDGNATAVENPLTRYTFRPIDPSFPPPYQSWQTTIRHPDSPDSPDATTDVRALLFDLSSMQDDITASTYNLLTRVHSWHAFSNHTIGDAGSASNSLEAIHDEIHDIIGGHMGDPAVAGFDPIFFLHHCNVDRMLSLWAAVNPEEWVVPGSAENGTFTIRGDAQVDNNTDLAPFWLSETVFWKSSQANTTESLRYSYPEFNNLNMNDQGAVRIAIVRYINQHYGGFVGPTLGLPAQPAAGDAPAQPAAGDTPAQPATGDTPVQPAAGDAPTQPAAGDTPVQPAAGDAPAPQAPGTISATAPVSTIEPAAEKEGLTVIHDWTVRIRFKKYELGGSFAVLIFLGEVPDDPSLWRTSSSFVGAHVAFVNSAASRCGNCRSQAHIVIEGFVHLNGTLARRSGLPSLEPDVVTPYLKKNLRWRIQASNRTAVPKQKLPSLEITVVQTPLTHEHGNVFPTLGNQVFHPIKRTQVQQCLDSLCCGLVDTSRCRIF